MIKPFLKVGILFSALMIVHHAIGQSRLFYDLEDQTKNTSDAKITFPKDPPQEKDLYPFSPSANSKTLEFYFDQKNIFVDKDVVRYVVVIKSPEGAQQALFGGVDCNRSMKIIYARLQDQQWVESKDETWKIIGNLGYNNYAAYLARKALCSGDSANSSTKNIVERLKASEMPLNP
jgi:CNP1-like family